MYRLAVLEDDPAQLELLADLALATPLGPRLEVERFSSAAGLEGATASGEAFDVLLADIRLSDDAETGIDVVRALPEGARTQVVYVTGYDTYHSDVYETDHAYFLMKPVSAERMARALEVALARLEERAERPLRLRTGADQVVVEPRDVLFAESRRRVVDVHLADGRTLSTYLRLDELERELPRRFVRCHQSFLVSLARVARYRVSELELDDGTVVPVSQSHRAAVRDAFFSEVRPVR